MKELIGLCAITSLLVAVAFTTSAQSISPQVVASSGAHATSPYVQLSWTVGEVVVTTLTGGGGLITQGFHQTYDVATIAEEAPLGLSVNVFPNPATDLLQIALSGEFPDIELALMDMSGKLVGSQMLRSGTSGFNFGVGFLAKGTYVLRLSSKDGDVMYSYRIIKQ